MTARPRVGLRAVIAASPQRSVVRWLWWHMWRVVCVVWFGLCYRYRTHDTRHFPRTGPVLIVANHQSFLDSIIVGLATQSRSMYSLARSSLFGKRVLGWFIRTLNAIPVEREAADIKAMRRCVEVLQQGAALALFPEGTRTPDGDVHAFRTGLMLLIKRARPTVVPLAIDGSFDAWPRDRKRPKLFGRIAAQFGQPIPAEHLLDMDTDAAVELLRQRVTDLKAELSQKRQRRASGGTP